MRGDDLRRESRKLRKVPRPFMHLALPPLRVNAEEIRKIRFWN
jgi:hypothetical protein